MPIRYALFENNVTVDPDDFVAVVQIGGGTELRIGRLDPVLTVQADKLGNLGGLCGVSGRRKTVSKLESGPAPSLASVAAPKPGLGTEVNLTSEPSPLGYRPWST